MWSVRSFVAFPTTSTSTRAKFSIIFQSSSVLRRSDVYHSCTVLHLMTEVCDINFGRYLCMAGNYAYVATIGQKPIYNSSSSQASWNCHAILENIGLKQIPVWPRLNVAISATTNHKKFKKITLTNHQKPLSREINS
jgi:hypothetical protein